MKQIHKNYERPFSLEKTKLDRLMDIVHGRLGEHQNTTKRDYFEVFLSGQRHEEMTSVEDVLKLDNSRKSKIQRLLITCCASNERAARQEHEIQIDFDGRIEGKNKTKVIVSVRSDDAGWSDRALSEVEEQVERAFIQDVQQRVALGILGVSVFIVLLFLVVSSLTYLDSARGDADVMWLRLRDTNRVGQILKQGRTITDEEMREIATMQLRNVLEVSGYSHQLSGWTKQKTFIGVPLLAVLACALYLVGRCYPSAVFLWGDEVERYNKMLHARRIVWGIIISLVIVGVFSKLLVMGLFPGP